MSAPDGGGARERRGDAPRPPARGGWRRIGAGRATAVTGRMVRGRFVAVAWPITALLLGVALPLAGQSSPAAQTVPEGGSIPGRPVATASDEPQPLPAAQVPGTVPEPAAPEPAAADRITFTLPFPEERGGGEASGSAAALDYQREDFALLSGGVELRYQDVVLRAREISIDLGTKELTALGDVIIDQGPSRLTGSSATYDLDTKTGTLRQATGSAPQGIYFTGEQISKVGVDEYVIEKGVFTSCEGPAPSWSFRVGRARIRLEDYAHVRNASMRVKSLPVLYLPYMIWPTKTERASGFLVPKIGKTDHRGGYLGLAYYQVLGRSWDTTLYADIYSRDYFAFGDELRYRPSENTRGRVRGWAIDDPLREEVRWKVQWDHDTRDLPLGLRGVVQFEDYSDFEFFRDFERGLDQKARSSVYSQGFLTGNWGHHSVNLLADRRQTFLGGGNRIELRQLPELEYRLRPTRLGRAPVYLSFDGAAHYLSVDRGSGYAGEYGRLELSPRLKVPLSPAPWLSLSLTAGERLTWYGDSLGLSGGEQVFTGETLTRALPTAGAELIGPSFSRIFGGRGSSAAAAEASGRRYKHVIEPRFAWAYAGDFDEQAEVPIFDELDAVGGLNIGRVALINRLLAKPAGEKGGAAREVLSVELARRYGFDRDQPLESGLGEQRAWGPAELIVRANPTERFGLRFDADYSVLFGQLTGLRASGNFALGRQRFDFTWSPRWRDLDGEVLSNQGSLGVQLKAGKGGRLTLASLLAYDFERDLLRDQRHLATWRGSCYAVRLEVHESTTVTTRRRDYLFSIDLKNVGTFLDLTGGETTEGL